MYIVRLTQGLYKMFHYSLKQSRYYVYWLLLDTLMRGYIDLYKRYGFSEPYFFFLGLDPIEVSKLPRTGINAEIRWKIISKLHIRRTVDSIITNSFLPHDEYVCTLDKLFRSPVIQYEQKIQIDRIFCDALVKKRLDRISYIDYPLNRFLTTTPIDATKAVELIMYLFTSCLAKNVDEYFPKYVILVEAKKLLNAELIDSLLNWYKLHKGEATSIKGAKQLYELVKELKK